MITFDELKEYTSNKSLEGLVSITPTFSGPKDALDGYNVSFTFTNIRLTETYIFFDEAKVDECINKAKESEYFAACSKTYKDAKLSKDGDVLRDAYWKVRITYKDQ